MVPPGSLDEPISAPDLTGPVSIVDWPTSMAAAGPRRRTRPFSHVALDIDLRHERLEEPSFALLRQFERLLREREVVEPADLLRLAAGALHGLAARRFTHVDHWEMVPGGWLPLPEPTHRTLAEPVGHLVRALASEQWRSFATAREFRVRVSGHPSIRADLVVRRVHRERGHSLSIDLFGIIEPRDLAGLVRAIRERIPILRASVRAFTYASALHRRRGRTARSP